MKNLLIAMMFSLLFTLPASAAELLMIHHPQCPFCQAFMRDVEPEYDMSEQGKEYPLRVIDVSVTEDRDWISYQVSVEHIDPIRGTPTFIIWDNGREIGRFIGYGGKEWFYHYLDETIKRSVQGSE